MLDKMLNDKLEGARRAMVYWDGREEELLKELRDVQDSKSRCFREIGEFTQALDNLAKGTCMNVSEN